MATHRQYTIDEAFEQIEETILPSLSTMLDTLLDAAALAQPGIDAEIHAAELRALALQLESITRQMEAISASGDPQERRAASAA